MHFKNNKNDYLFKIFHEIYHDKTYDNSLGYVYAISLQILKLTIIIVYLVIITNFVSTIIYYPYIGEYINITLLSDIVLWIAIYTLYTFISKIITKSFSLLQYFKECLCDRHAAIIFKNNSLTIPEEVFPIKKSLKHPSRKDRIRCTNGEILFGKRSSYIFVTILVLSYFPNYDNEVYRDYNTYLLMSSLTILLGINLLISNRKNIYSYSIIYIFVGSIVIYYKTKLYYIWFYGYMISEKNINYGLNFNINNTITHLIFFLVSSISILTLIELYKKHEKNNIYNW